MLPKELAKKLKYLQIRTSRKVDDVMTGEYRSAFRGTGMEFDEVREYQPGDEVRSIDWNVTARQGRPFIKRFHEERELTVLFAVDMSGSGRFGSGSSTKNELAAELSALLAFAAVRSQDKVGLVLFTDRIELFIPPAKGLHHALRIVREVLAFTPSARGTDIRGALDFCAKILHRRSIVFLISDFLDSGYDMALRRLELRHDMIAVTVTDPRELSLPDVGLLELHDAETGRACLVDTSSPRVRLMYEAAARERRAALEKQFKRLNVDHLSIMTDTAYEKQLAAFFRRRENMIR